MQSPFVEIKVGHVLDVLREMEDNSVQCVVTSPPYWGLRDFSGGDNSLDVEWGDGWTGQLGLEPTPELYVKHIVSIFQEVKRVLRDDGTLWLNMGDCYASSPVGSFNQGGFKDKSAQTGGRNLSGVETSGILDKLKDSGPKPKDLVGLPWRVAFALQNDGWYLRSDIIWSKPNPMPESVTDRPTKAHEYIFLLTKSARYFYDQEAVREPNQDRLGADRLVEAGGGRSAEHISSWKAEPRSGEPDVKDWPIKYRRYGRNKRTVWEIATQPYPEAHFATFPEKLVEPCIKAGTPEKGSCNECGAPWERVVEKPDTPKDRPPLPKQAIAPGGVRNNTTFGSFPGWRDHDYFKEGRRTIGFRPTCDHDADPVPAIVLDPFAGSGTVGKVARWLGRSCVLIEIKEEYADLARKRTRSNLQTIYGYE